MTIAFRCPQCGTDLKAPDEYAGGKARCKTCATPVIIPKVGQRESASGPASPSSDASGDPPASPSPQKEPAHEDPCGDRGKLHRAARELVDRPMVDRQVPTTGSGFPRLIIFAIAGLVLLATGVIVGVVLRKSAQDGAEPPTVAGAAPTELDQAGLKKDVDQKGPPIVQDMGFLVGLQLDMSAQWDECFDPFNKTAIQRFRLTDGEDLLAKARRAEKLSGSVQVRDERIAMLNTDYFRAAEQQTRAIELMLSAVDESLASETAAERAGVALDLWEDSQKKIRAWAFRLRMATAADDEPLPYLSRLDRLEAACARTQFEDPDADALVHECVRYAELARKVLILHARVERKLAGLAEAGTAERELSWLEQKVLPVQREMLLLATSNLLTTPEISEVHDVLISAEEQRLERLNLLVESMRQRGNETLGKEALGKVLVAKRLFNEWQARLSDLVQTLKAQKARSDGTSPRSTASSRKSFQKDMANALDHAWTKCSSRSRPRARAE